MVVRGLRLRVGRQSMGQRVGHFCFDSLIGYLVDYAQIMINKSIWISLILAHLEILEELVGEPCEQQAQQFLQPCMEVSLIS